MSTSDWYIVPATIACTSAFVLIVLILVGAW
jgi:hypothetical protein